ncbi:MAG: extracellular solute-binding protein [Clostridiaceae bacterium]|nr:extracellular solute-binding protein [Clostridiaceae bacterium]
MKKTIVLLLLVSMVLLTACDVAGPNNQPTNAPDATGPTTSGPSGEKVTLKAFQWALGNQQTDFNNLWFYEELEKKTNVHVEFEPVKEDDWDTKINLMFASGNWPDLIIRGQVDIEEYGVTQGIILPLDDYLEEYMPNYYPRLSMNNSNASIPASDGKTYFIGNLTAQNINHDGNHYINKAWLDNLGLEIPTTIDELTNVLKAFRDNDANGNGDPNDEIPFIGADLIHQTQGLYNHFANFGVPLVRWVYACIDDDQNVVFPGYLPGFRDALEWFNMCYEEKLLDPESITMDSNVWGTKMNADLCGYTTYLRLINTALTPEIAENYVSIIPPASKYGVKVPRILEVAEFGAALTVANKHIPETLKWLDAQFETETMMTAVNGPVMPGGPIDQCMKLNDQGKYEVLYIPENNGLYQYVPVTQGQFFAPGDYYFDIYQMPPHRVERYNSSKDYEAAGVLEKYSFDYLNRLVKMNNEDSLEKTRLFNEIEKFMKESITNFITNGVTDASWQNFLDTSKEVGVDKYIELYQKAYDNYLANN